MRTVGFLLIAFAVLARAAASPLTPQAAHAALQAEPGLRVELVAAEPLTASPCALTWDERGRLFVAENRGYPTGSPDGKPLGVIALLEDSDGDGRLDKRTVFADGLTFPNGLTPWRDGLIVTCAPDVLWLADTNGDGRADVRRVWLTGFSTSGSTQLRVSHPTLGPDGWIWLTCGLSGANITAPDYPERPPLKTATDVRFHPDTLEVEAVDGRGQFGQSFDELGRRFICMNRVQVQHVVWPSRARKRTLTFSETVQNCPELVANPFLPGNNGAARIYPLSANYTTADSHAGTFTAACGVHIYRGDALPGYRGRAFSCDPTGNLVHWDELIPVGATFAARRSTNAVEFLASTDNWFRPVFLATGPDGALYVADMYRKTIEHPEYLPIDVRQHTDFESGREMGRIWRVTVVPEPALGNVPGLPPRPLPSRLKEQGKGVDLATAPSAELCRVLEDPNGWRRDAAFRLLVERRETNLVSLLRKQRSIPALRLLEILGALDDDTLGLAGFSGLESDGVLRAADVESTLELVSCRRTISPSVQKAVVKWTRRENRIGFLARLLTAELPYETLRRELFVTWGSVPPEPGLELGLNVTPQQQDPSDRWQQVALLSCISGHALFLQDIVASLAGEGPRRFHVTPELMFELARLAAGEGKEVRSIVSTLGEFARQCAETEEATRRLRENAARSSWQALGPWPKVEWELPVLHGLVEGLRARATSPDVPLLSPLLSGNRGSNSISAREGVLLRSRRALTNEQPVLVRVAAVALLAELGEDRERVLGAFQPDAPLELQRGAVRAFVRLADTNAAATLLAADRWRSYSPAMRETVLAELFAHAALLAALLDAVEAGVIPANAIDAARRAQLLKRKDDSIRRRAEALFKQPATGDRLKAYESSKASLALPPNAANGHEVFRRTCANCHRLDREGVAVGPDLFGIRNQPKETILLHIIVPEFEIAPNFTGYTVETRDERTLSGLVAGESPAGVTLRQALGIEEMIPRSNIVSMEAMRLSLMPQELEKAMTMQELADLLAYLRGEK